MKTLTSIPKTVDDYLEAHPPEIVQMMEELRSAIRKAAPKAEEIISYQIPTYKYKGALVHFAIFKNHCSFFGVDKNLLKSFSKELEPFDVKGTTIHFTLENPLPSSLTQKLVKERLKQNEARDEMKKPNKKSVKRS
ncbi:MAG TPA: DUF1801 domain-containing protein [Chryseosolibacter sp.]|nr:DUF1801 domain-containing protein [Chryseosolibacter sp.]